MIDINDYNLTDKQKAFILEYVQDFNATRAEKAVGYAASYGSQILKSKEISRFLRDYFSSQEKTTDDVIKKLQEIAFIPRDDYSEVSQMKALDLLMRAQEHKDSDIEPTHIKVERN